MISFLHWGEKDTPHDTAHPAHACARGVGGIFTARHAVLDDVSARDVDVCIAFGDGNWPKHSLKHLYDVEFLPLCSPMLLNVQGGLGMQLTEPKSGRR